MARYSGKADPSLVEGAYRAAMANIPHDYSRAFERVADSYDRTMRNVNAVWNIAGKIGGQYLGQAIDGFATRAKYKAVGETFRNTEGVNAIMDGYTFVDQKPNDDFIVEREESETNPRFITEETRVMGLNEIHNAIWDTYRKDPLKAFSAENKKLRNELNLKATKIYSQMDILEAGFNNINNIVASKAYNKEAMKHGHGDARLLAALGAFESSSGKVQSDGMNNGDYLQLGWDRNGDMVFNLFNNGNPILNDMLDPNSGQVSVPVDGVDDIVVKNDRKFTKNASALINKYIENVTKNPQEIEKMNRAFNNSFDGLITTENQLMHGIYEDKYSSFSSSMMEDMASPSLFSATIFSTLLDDPNAFYEDGTVVPNEATQEWIDSGGINVSGGSNPDGLDVDDFSGDEIAATENMAKVMAIYSNRRHPLYKEENTRHALKQWVSQKAGDQVKKNLKIARQIEIDKQRRLSEILTADQIQSNDILKAWGNGNFEGLVLKNRTDARSTGTIKTKEDGSLYLEEQDSRGNLIETPIDTTNKGLQKLLYLYGGDHGIKIYDQLKKKGNLEKNLFGSNYNPNEFNADG